MSKIDNNTMIYLRGDTYNDLSLNPKTVVNTSTTVTTVGGYTGIKLTNGYLKIIGCLVGLDWSKDMTIEWWEYALATSFTGGGIFQNRSNTTTANTQNGLLLGYTGKGFHISYNTSWSGGYTTSTGCKDLTLNTWVYWSLVKTGTTWKMYKNGTQFWTLTNSVVPNSCDWGLQIGKWMSSQNYEGTYNAVIRDYHVSNVARYTGNYTVSTEPSTSVQIKNIKVVNGNIMFNVAKSPNESISKIEILVNGDIVNTITTCTPCMSDKVYDYLNDGENNITIRAYYYSNYFVEESINYIKENKEKLNNENNIFDFYDKIKEVNQYIGDINNELSNKLANKNIEINEEDNKLSTLISKVQNLPTNK